MPQLLTARPAKDEGEARHVRKLAARRHARGAWIRRARMIGLRWEGKRTAAMAAAVGCHAQTVRERLARFNAEGLDGLGDQPGGGRKRRRTEAERGQIIAMVGKDPPGRLVTDEAGTVGAADEAAAAHRTLTALTAAAREAGMQIARSQVRRIFVAAGVRWRQPRSWATSTDPEFSPQGKRAARSTPSRPRRRPFSASPHAAP